MGGVGPEPKLPRSRYHDKIKRMKQALTSKSRATEP